MLLLLPPTLLLPLLPLPLPQLQYCAYFLVRRFGCNGSRRRGAFFTFLAHNAAVRFHFTPTTAPLSLTLSLFHSVTGYRGILLSFPSPPCAVVVIVYISHESRKFIYAISDQGSLSGDWWGWGCMRARRVLARVTTAPPPRKKLRTTTPPHSTTGLPIGIPGLRHHSVSL